MKNQKTLMLVEGAVMIALAAVLSLVKVYKLPWGGSITLLSMVPICLYSIKRGAAAGMAVSFVYSVVQLLLDLGEVLSWGLTAGTLVACFALDYILAYSALGTAGIFRRFGTKGWIAGCVFALLLRLLITGLLRLLRLLRLFGIGHVDFGAAMGALHGAHFVFSAVLLPALGAIVDKHNSKN